MSITRGMFNEAVRSCGYSTPPAEVFDAFVSSTKYMRRNELAMFLAQTIHESAGFQHREEDRPDSGAYADEVGLPDRSYHGRGYIRVTRGANYLAASEGLGFGDELLRQPELIAENIRLSMDVSVWYWNERVRPVINGREDCFGLTTKAINGDAECTGGYNATARRRYDNYLKVADILEVEEKASECGCYN